MWEIKPGLKEIGGRAEMVVGGTETAGVRGCMEIGGRSEIVVDGTGTAGLGGCMTTEGLSTCTPGNFPCSVSPLTPA